MVRRIFLAASLFLFVGIHAAKADSTATLNGTNAGTFSFNGVDYDLSPYGGTLGTSSVQFICVDQAVGVPANGFTWTVNVISIPNGSFTGTVQGNQMTYEEMAYLAQQMLDALANNEPGVATAYQFAIWSFTGGPDPFAISNPQYDVSNLVAQAAAAVAGGYNGSGWEVVTPDAGVGQEMLVETPEPSGLLLLGCGLVLAGFTARNRLRA